MLASGKTLANLALHHGNINYRAPVFYNKIYLQKNYRSEDARGEALGASEGRKAVAAMASTVEERLRGARPVE